MNIVDPTLFQCRCQPLALALCASGSNVNAVTYGRLERFIRLHDFRMPALVGRHLVRRRKRVNATS
jgi:hypothetical protein